MRRNVQDIPPLPSWIMIKSPHLLVLIYSFLPLDIKHKKQCCAKLHIKSCNYHNKIAIFNTHIIQKSHSKNPHSPASWGSPWMFWRKGTLTKSKKNTMKPMWFSQVLLQNGYLERFQSSPGWSITCFEVRESQLNKAWFAKLPASWLDSGRSNGYLDTWGVRVCVFRLKKHYGISRHLLVQSWTQFNNNYTLW